MNKNKQSYSNMVSSDSGTAVYVEADKFYNSEKIKKEDSSHNAFEKNDYFERKMTFGKIKYVQK